MSSELSDRESSPGALDEPSTSTGVSSERKPSTLGDDDTSGRSETGASSGVYSDSAVEELPYSRSLKPAMTSA